MLDEEGSQMGELPSAGSSHDDQLNDDPPDDSTVGYLGLISELGFTLLFKLLAKNWGVDW